MTLFQAWAEARFNVAQVLLVFTAFAIVLAWLCLPWGRRR